MTVWRQSRQFWQWFLEFMLELIIGSVQTLASLSNPKLKQDHNRSPTCKRQTPWHSLSDETFRIHITSVVYCTIITKSLLGWSSAARAVSNRLKKQRLLRSTERIWTSSSSAWSTFSCPERGSEQNREHKIHFSTLERDTLPHRVKLSRRSDGLDQTQESKSDGSGCSVDRAISALNCELSKWGSTHPTYLSPALQGSHVIPSWTSRRPLLSVGRGRHLLEESVHIPQNEHLFWWSVCRQFEHLWESMVGYMSTGLKVLTQLTFWTTFSCCLCESPAVTCAEKFHIDYLHK